MRKKERKKRGKKKSAQNFWIRHCVQFVVASINNI